MDSASNPARVALGLALTPRLNALLGLVFLAGYFVPFALLGVSPLADIR